jgi:hypothetical protein
MMQYLLSVGLVSLLLILSLVLGWLIFSLLKINLSKHDGIESFNMTLIGLCAMVGIYACIKTNFNTVMLGLFICIAAYSRTAQLEKKFTDTNLSLFKQAASLLFFGIIFTTYQFYLFHKTDVYADFDRDYLYYSKIAENLNSIGLESYSNIVFGNVNSANTIVNSPYHFFELWIAAIGLNFSNLLAIESFLLIATPIISALCVFGIYTFSKSMGNKWLVAGFLCLLFFTQPIDLLGNPSSGGLAAVSPFKAVKYSVVYLFLLFGLINYAENRQIPIKAMAFIPIASITAAPSVLGASFALLFIGFLLRKNFKAHLFPSNKEYYSTFAVVIFLFLYYGLFNRPTTTTTSIPNPTSVILNNLDLVGRISIGGLIYLGSIFLIHLFFLIFALGKNIALKKHLLIIIYTSLVLLSGVVFWGLLFFEGNLMQAFTVSAIQLLCAGFAIIIISAISIQSNNKKILFIILIVISLLFSFFRAHKVNDNYIYKRYNQISVEDKRFRERVLGILSSPTSPKDFVFSIVDKSSPDFNIFYYGATLFTMGWFVHMYMNGVSILNLNAHDLFLDNPSELINPKDSKFDKKHALNSIHTGASQGENLLHYKLLNSASMNPFFNYIKNENQTNLTIDQYRSDFVAKNRMRIGFLNRCSLLPKALESRVEVQFEHARSGECFVLLKAWD